MQMMAYLDLTLLDLPVTQPRPDYQLHVLFDIIVRVAVSVRFSLMRQRTEVETFVLRIGALFIVRLLASKVRQGGDDDGNHSLAGVQVDTVRLVGFLELGEEHCGGV